MQFFYSTAFTQSRNQAYGRYSREKYGSENSFSINFPGEKKKKKNLCTALLKTNFFTGISQ